METDPSLKKNDGTSELYSSGRFSLTPTLLQLIFEKAKPLGHGEKKEQLNLGFGFVYYGLGRALRPKHVVVIGSGYGFSVVCLALACKDNGKGKVSFVDPAFAWFREGPFQTLGGTGMWKKPEQVINHFSQFGVENQVSHFRLTSREFFLSYNRYGLPAVDLGFIDGNHSYSHVREDFLALCSHSRPGAYLFLHDTHLPIRERLRHSGVKRWLKVVKDHQGLFEVIDFPFSSGVALVRILPQKKKKLDRWIREMKDHGKKNGEP
jgi:pimeloyl-ACP methyl ester carboxylesterase